MSDRPARILFVDDDADTRDAMVRLLRGEGYSVIAAGTCQAAMRSAAEMPIDLLITDLLLPDSDGVTVLKRIRLVRSVEGILVTGVADAPVAGDDFARRFTKPIVFADLFAAIKDVLAVRESVPNIPTSVPLPAGRIAALREKVKHMTAAELSALGETLRRSASDLSEEMRVLQELIVARKLDLAQKYLR